MSRPLCGRPTLRPGERTERLAVRVPASLAAALRAYAERVEEAPSWVVRQALEDYLRARVERAAE